MARHVCRAHGCAVAVEGSNALGGRTGNCAVSVARLDGEEGWRAGLRRGSPAGWSAPHGRAADCAVSVVPARWVRGVGETVLCRSCPSHRAAPLGSRTRGAVLAAVGAEMLVRGSAVVVIALDELAAGDESCPQALSRRNTGSRAHSMGVAIFRASVVSRAGADIRLSPVPCDARRPQRTHRGCVRRGTQRPPMGVRSIARFAAAARCLSSRPIQVTVWAAHRNTVLPAAALPCCSHASVHGRTSLRPNAAVRPTRDGPRDPGASNRGQRAAVDGEGSRRWPRPSFRCRAMGNKKAPRGRFDDPRLAEGAGFEPAVGY